MAIERKGGVGLNGDDGECVIERMDNDGNPQCSCDMKEPSKEKTKNKIEMKVPNVDMGNGKKE